MWHQLKNSKFYVMLLGDAVIFATAYVCAYLLRFEFAVKPADVHLIKAILLYLIPSKLAVFYGFGLYRGMWRYSGIDDLWRLAQASFLSTLCAVFLVLYLHGFGGVSRSVFVLDGLLTFLLAGGLRIGIRSWFMARAGSEGIRLFPLRSLIRRHKEFKHVLIIGAGGSGEKLLREIFDNPHLHYHVVGFLDDDPGKRGRALHGVRVLGGVKDLPELIDKYGAQEVLISAPSATGTEMRRMVEICKACEVSYKTLPAIGEIINGKVSVKALREVSYEDLLRRPPVRLDMAGIRDYLCGRTVLVTGAGGSIGSELCRQLVRFDPGKLILVDASEANLFHIQMELHHEQGFEDYQCILSRVQDRPLMEDIFKEFRPEVVLHAAAYKHVPMLEKNPWEAVFNNVLGSQITMELSRKHHVERFVLVSTDKAVRPTNVMGTTKRVTELLMQAYQGNGTRYMAVRFGNVVGSSGSVIPLFERQISQGGPVTVTHPEVTRYFMTIPEACQLILQAGALGEGGEIFVLEMGTPVKIADMARDLIRLSGREPDKDIEIVYTGLREGEKLYEELITAGEDIAGTRHEKIMVLLSNGRWNWNGRKTHAKFCAWLEREIEALYGVARTHDACGIKRKLKDIVSEYTPQETCSVLERDPPAKPLPQEIDHNRLACHERG